MGDLKSFFPLLKDGLTILNTYKAVMEFGPKIINYGKGLLKRSYYDVHEIFPALIESDLKLGDVVECSGFLSKYSQTFMPMTFLPSVAGPSSEKVMSTRFNQGKIEEKRQITTSWQV